MCIVNSPPSDRIIFHNYKDVKITGNNSRFYGRFVPEYKRSAVFLAKFDVVKI